MLTLLLGLFALVMLAGLGLAFMERRGRAPPLRVSVSHGGLGVAAILFLLMQAMDHPGNYPLNISIVVFILTAVGGLLLLAFRASRQRLPFAVVLLHAGFAVTAFLLLLAGWRRVQGG